MTLKGREIRIWSFTGAPFSVTRKISLETTHQTTTRSGAALTKVIWSTAVCPGRSLRIGFRLKANSKVRRSLCEPQEEKNTDREISSSNKRHSMGEWSHSNAGPGTLHTHEGHFANRHPHGSPRHFCLKLQSGPGSNNGTGARG